MDKQSNMFNRCGAIRTTKFYYYGRNETNYQRQQPNFNDDVRDKNNAPIKADSVHVKGSIFTEAVSRLNLR